jgi:hypothetical protein
VGLCGEKTEIKECREGEAGSAAAADGGEGWTVVGDDDDDDDRAGSACRSLNLCD